MSQTPLTELKQRLQQLGDLTAASSLLVWDQATYLPPAGATARAGQTATLSRIAHEMFTSPEIGRLLDVLEPAAAGMPPDSDDACLLRVTRRDYEHAIRVPASFQAAFEEHLSASYQVWVEARPADDFSRVVPYLERTLELSRQYADFFPGYQHVADPHIDANDEGMTVGQLRPLFAELRAELMPLLDAINARGPSDASVLEQPFPESQQLVFGLELAQAFGFDLRRGRQDLTHHPFAIGIGPEDVRITTRIDGRDLGGALFSTLHEAGHGIYEQGIDRALVGTPLASGVSSGVHESQSRLWENLVGRSLPFWEYAFPHLQARFPAQLGEVPLERFYRAVNRVAPSLIRTEADEVSYNLHIIVRFDLECDLLEGKLAVRDLPAAWRERYRSDLGVAPETDHDGVLQDVHWFSGAIGGAFQGYTLGNILSAQFFAAAAAADGDVTAGIAGGSFAPLHHWLRTRIYRHGRKFPPNELVRRATGRDLEIAPYLDYLRDKYGRLYELDS